MIPRIAGGYYGDDGRWIQLKRCFVNCGAECNCQPPRGELYNEQFDKRKGAMSKKDEIRIATCTHCGKRGGHWPTCTVGLGRAPSDDFLRTLWVEMGGEFHGPNIETGTMPEERLLPFLRSLLMNEDWPA